MTVLKQSHDWKISGKLFHIAYAEARLAMTVLVEGTLNSLRDADRNDSPWCKVSQFAQIVWRRCGSGLVGKSSQLRVNTLLDGQPVK